MTKSLLPLLMVLAWAQTVPAQTEAFDIVTFVPPNGWARTKTGVSVSYEYQDVKSDGRTVNCSVSLRASRRSNGNPAQNFDEEWAARLGGLFSVRPSIKPNNVETGTGWTTVSGFVNATPGLPDVPGRTTLVTKTGFGKVVSVQVRTSPPEGCSAEIARFLDSVKPNGLFEARTAQTEDFDIASVAPPKGWEWSQTDAMAIYEVRRTTSEGNELCRIQLWASRPSTGTPAEDFEKLWDEKARRANRIAARPSTTKTERIPGGWTTVSGVVDSFGASEQRGMSMVRIYTGFGKVFTAFVLASKPNACVREFDEFFSSLKLKTFEQDQTLILRYAEPRGFYRSAITPPDDYSATQFSGSLQVYPFRRFNGDIQRMFTTTLLREWIDPRYQETNVAGRPEFRESRDGSFPGAQYVMMATFVENNVGIAKPHMRWVVVAGGSAALVDTSASDDPTMRRGLLPLLDAWFPSLRVEAAPTAAPRNTPPRSTQGPGSAGHPVAGLYMALVNHPRAFTTSSLAAYYYLFSAEGRVYRHYDELSVPGGDPSRFDFDAAERADPVNSGRYSLEGNVLRIQMGAQRSEVITTRAPEGGRLKIGSTEFERQ